MKDLRRILFLPMEILVMILALVCAIFTAISGCLSALLHTAIVWHSVLLGEKEDKEEPTNDV